MAEDQDWAHPSCSVQYIQQHIPRMLPQASIPKNAAVGGCKEASYMFAKCIKVHLTHMKERDDGKPSALRGSVSGEGVEQDDVPGHASKLSQLKNWKK
jgi:hypothetical protein